VKWHNIFASIFCSPDCSKVWSVFLWVFLCMKLYPNSNPWKWIYYLQFPFKNLIINLTVVSFFTTWFYTSAIKLNKSWWSKIWNFQDGADSHQGLHPEDKGSRVLYSIGILPQHYTASQLKSPWLDLMKSNLWLC